MRDKRQSYSREEVVRRYDRKRFEGSSGRFVNDKEMAFVRRVAGGLAASRPGRKAVALDAPCGTGRASRALAEEGLSVVGLDYSSAMLRQSAQVTRVPLTRGDIMRLPLRDASVDCVVTLRFLFHYEDIEPLTREVSRVLKRGGMAVFDTCSWSPKANPLFGARRVFVHGEPRVRQLLQASALQVVEKKGFYLLSPMLYRRLPIGLVKALDVSERLLPSWLLSRVFWAARKQ